MEFQSGLEGTRGGELDECDSAGSGFRGFMEACGGRRFGGEQTDRGFRADFFFKVAGETCSGGVVAHVACRIRVRPSFGQKAKRTHRQRG